MGIVAASMGGDLSVGGDAANPLTAEVAGKAPSPDIIFTEASPPDPPAENAA